MDQQRKHATACKTPACSRIQRQHAAHGSNATALIRAWHRQPAAPSAAVEASAAVQHRYVGQGVVQGDAVGLLKRFADKAQIPVTTSLQVLREHP
jgi:thiamine pyrophosphate-dependent acetolactate synthase large subunit-like protein